MERTTTVPGWGEAIRRVYPPGTWPVPGAPGRQPQALTAAEQGILLPSVVSLRTPVNSSSLIVFVNIQQEYLAKLRMLAISRIDCALDKWRKVLDHSRKTGFPVAFIRMIHESAFFNRVAPFVPWIEGVEPHSSQPSRSQPSRSRPSRNGPSRGAPHRNQMIFERKSPTCYSDEPFIASANQRRSGVLMAGFAGASACLPALIDAFDRNRKVTSICDTSLRCTSASHALDEMPAADVQRAVSKRSGIYKEVFETDDWIEQTSARNFGYGKNAGG